MSVELLLQNASKPWCDIYVHKLTCDEFVGPFGAGSGRGSTTCLVNSGFAIVSFVANYIYSIVDQTITVSLISPTLTSNNNTISIDFNLPVLPDKNWVDVDADVAGTGSFSTGTASNNTVMQCFAKDTSSKIVRASGVASANGASGRIMLTLQADLSP